MTVNMAMDLGGQRNPKKPTNRIVNAGTTKGVTVVNMSEESLRRHSEVLDLRRLVTKYKRDLEASMNALSMANMEIERLKGLTYIDASDFESLRNENDRLSAEVAHAKDIEKSLKDEISELRGYVDDARSELDRRESENNRLKEETLSLRELVDNLNEKIKECDSSASGGVMQEGSHDNMSKKRRKRRSDQNQDLCKEEQDHTPEVQGQVM